MFSSIFIFLIVLSLLILVHEVGHFIAARRNGVWVEEFGIGIPPRLYGKKIGETIYSINLLPFGGFVRLHGEQTEEGITKPNRAFLNKDKKTKTKIVTAGVVMNFVLAIVAFSIVYSFSGVPRETGDIRVVEIADNSPAKEAGIVTGDIIRGVGGAEISSTDEFVEIVAQNANNEVALSVQKEGGEIENVALVPRDDPPEGEGPVGVAISSVEIYYPPVWQRPFLGVYYGFQEAIFWGVTVVFGLGRIIFDLFGGTVPKDVAGPVGIFALTSQAASFGALALINFVGVFSVNLAILNILPFPALDGGRLLFIVIESIFGKKILPRVEATIHAIGMAVLLLLVVAVTFFDIKRLISAGSISGFLESVLK
jgi:regulator of sigma E protease